MSKHGENIRKRKDGRWEGRFIKGRKSDRTAIWGYIYGHSYTEVKEKLTIKKMEVQQFALNVDNPTFSELSLTWESSIFLGVKSSTAAHYHYTLQHYILPVLGPYRVQALNESILERSLLEIVAPADKNHKVLGNAMSKECLTLVRRICRYAVHLHIMRPIEIDLKLPTVNPSNTSVLNNLEQKSVYAFVRSSPTPRRLGNETNDPPPGHTIDFPHRPTGLHFSVVYASCNIRRHAISFHKLPHFQVVSDMEWVVCKGMQLLYWYSFLRTVEVRNCAFTHSSACS